MKNVIRLLEKEIVRRYQLLVRIKDSHFEHSLVSHKSLIKLTEKEIAEFEKAINILKKEL